MDPLHASQRASGWSTRPAVTPCADQSVSGPLSGAKRRLRGHRQVCRGSRARSIWRNRLAATWCESAPAAGPPGRRGRPGAAGPHELGVRAVDRCESSPSSPDLRLLPGISVSRETELAARWHRSKTRLGVAVKGSRPFTSDARCRCCGAISPSVGASEHPDLRGAQAARAGVLLTRPANEPSRRRRRGPHEPAGGSPAARIPGRAVTCGADRSAPVQFRLRSPSNPPIWRVADNDRLAEKLSTPVVHRHPPFHVKQRVGAGASLWMTACVQDLGSLWISPLGAPRGHAQPVDGGHRSGGP